MTMRLAHPFRAKAPSPALLRYLRSQFDCHSSFKPNPRVGLDFVDHTPRDIAWGISALRRPLPSSSKSPSVRRMSTFTAGRAGVDASAIQSSKLVQAKALRPRWITNNLQRLPTKTPCTVRYNSNHQDSDSDSWYRAILPKRSSKQPPEPPEASPPYDGAAEGNMFNLGRSMSGKASNELKLRCTEFDENGNVTLVNGEFKKSELIAKYGLLPRDLRKIDSSLLPHMLVRPSAILINLLHLRVLIKYNRVLVFDAYGSTDSYTQSLFMYDLEGRLRQGSSSQSGGLPYEFRALEAVLISVTSGLESEFEGVRDPVVRVLRELEEDIDRDKLRYLLVYSKKLGTFEQKAKLVRDAIDELLDADDDLAAMYLTDRVMGKKRGESDHTEIEMLLESYHKVCDEIVQVSGNIVSNIRNTEEIVKAILDANRNSLMLLDLKFSIGTLGIGSGAFVASLYGMNLKNFLEDSSMGFMGVTAWSFVFAIIVVSYGLKKLRRVQRVSMWGERGKGDRGSWRQVEPGWEGREARLKRLRQGDGGHGATEADRIVRERMAGVAPPALSPVPLSSPAAAAAATQAAARASAQAGTRRLKG